MNEIYMKIVFHRWISSSMDLIGMKNSGQYRSIHMWIHVISRDFQRFWIRTCRMVFNRFNACMICFSGPLAFVVVVFYNFSSSFWLVFHFNKVSCVYSLIETKMQWKYTWIIEMKLLNWYHCNKKKHETIMLNE